MTKPRRALHIELVPLTAEDLPAATELSRAVRWPHRLEDWQFVRAIGDGLTARVEGRFAGTAMSWAYEQTVTRVGMVLVDPEFQRAGIGRSLMSALLDRISAPAIMLNATDAGEALYNSLGFIEVATIIQHQGTSAAVPLVSLRAGERIRPLGRCDAMRLVELDAAAQACSGPA